jgi:hypothetical protein
MTIQFLSCSGLFHHADFIMNDSVISNITPYISHTIRAKKSCEMLFLVQ